MSKKPLLKEFKCELIAREFIPNKHILRYNPCTKQIEDGMLVKSINLVLGFMETKIGERSIDSLHKDDTYMLDAFIVPYKIAARRVKTSKLYVLDKEKSEIHRLGLIEFFTRDKVILCKDVSQYIDLMEDGEMIPYDVACFCNEKLLLLKQQENQKSLCVIKKKDYANGEITIMKEDGTEEVLTSEMYGNQYWFSKP